MPLILTIPREIRDFILELVVLGARSPPQHASTLQTRGRALAKDDCSYKTWADGLGIWYEDPDPKIHAFPILLVNRQLRAETLSVIRRLPKDYWVDLLLVDESAVWATWLSVPCLTTAVNKVQADIRMIGLSR